VTLRLSFRFDGLAVVNVAQRAFHLLISALNITMSQRKSVLYVSIITSTVSGVSLGRFDYSKENGPTDQPISS
jgi:hypothetical protein